MDVKKFTDFIKESVKINEKIELYRLVSVGNDEDLVIDVDNPGKYYFKDEGDIKPEVLKKQSGNYHIIKVTTDESNIDEELSKIIPQLEYKKIIVVCTLTEIGRSFNSHHDRYIDYHSWFKNNDYNNFLEFLNVVFLIASSIGSHKNPVCSEEIFTSLIFVSAIKNTTILKTHGAFFLASPSNP